MTLNRDNAIAGTLVADAAALGLHWMYDQTVIQSVETTGDILFREPDSNVFQGRKGYFAQGGRHAGELSHYGESARLVAQLAINKTYDAKAHQQAFFAVFGPCGSFRGYADHATKVLISRIIQDGDELPDASGSTDNQMPALAVVAGLFAEGHDLAAIMAAARVISIHEDVLAGAQVLFNCLEQLSLGASLSDSLKDSASTIDHPLSKLLHEALVLDSYQSREAASHFGLACPVIQSMPVVWHLLKHGEDFESVVRDNIRCGGDNCGRALAAGAVAGYAFGVPDTLIARMQGGRIPLNR